MRAVDPFKIRVKINTEMDNAAIMTNGRFLLPASATLEPRITGKRGNTHGASIVRTPAMNEMMKNVID